MQKNGLLVMMVSCVFLSGGSVVAEEMARPNVLLMMADDLANEDLSCYGSERMKTPRIDGLAAEGVKLSSYYSGSAVCTPARMAMLSGSYPARIGWKWGVMGYGLSMKTGMSSRVFTIAEAFRDGGYRTAISGKWHLGSNGMSPEDQGFDSAYCILMSNNQGRDMYRDGKLVKKDWDNRHLSEAFTEEVIRLIREPGDEPFFIYVPWTAPHFPAEPHPDWKGKSGEGRSADYKDVVEELDFRVGQILAALEEAVKAEDTIVIFTSDNGRQKGQEGAEDKPRYSGMKWQALEGGQRVPFVVRYPREIEKGKTVDAIVASMDLFPTLAGVCGVRYEVPEDGQKVDGLNVWKNLEEPGSAPVREELMYWHGRGEAAAIRTGSWKLHFNRNGKDEQEPLLEKGPALYNLDEDPMELKDMAEAHPKRVEEMKARARVLLEEIYENQLPLGVWPGVELEDAPLKASDVWGRWMGSGE